MVIEGVEKQDELDFVTKCGCEYIQGYLFSKPIPYEEFAMFLVEKNAI